MQKEKERDRERENDEEKQIMRNSIYILPSRF